MRKGVNLLFECSSTIYKAMISMTYYLLDNENETDVLAEGESDSDSGIRK